MMPATFDYFAPTSIDEALDLLNEHGDSAKLLAGGHSLIPAMKLRLAEPEIIIDIGRINALRGITESDGKLIIGSMTTHYDLESSDLAQQKVPLLSQTAAAIGDVQVRNKGTIGGSIAHADPAADWPAAILALDAEIKTIGLDGDRTINATDFFEGLYETALGSDEIITEIQIPIINNSKSVYLKQYQLASGFAIVGVAAVLVSSNGVCEKIAIGINGVSDSAYRATNVEADLIGKSLTADLIAEASKKAVDGVDALEDIHASGPYRENLAKVFTRRAISDLA